jgi:type IV pilus assembly protein PilA
MKTIKAMIKDTKKKAFTLIELLIVVAIIGILAGVGVPMYNGYMATAKIQSSATNHKNVKSFVAATLTKCSTGSQYVMLGSTNRQCNQSVNAWASYFRTYFNSINKNPYGGNVTTTSSSQRLGETNIAYSGNRIAIRTNIGTESGGNAYLPGGSGYDYIAKE